MTSFVNPDYPTEHRGVARVEFAVAALRRLRARFEGAKGLVAMLLAGAVSALVVVADQIVSSWTDGHLLMAWVVLWALVFAAVALFSETSRDWSVRAIAALEARARAVARRTEDERTWAVAQSDPRFMADLQAAWLRAESAALVAGEPLPQWPFAHVAVHRLAHYKSY